MFAIDSKPLWNGVWKVRYLISLLKLSGLCGTRAHIQAIRIIMKKFQFQISEGSSREVQDTPYMV